jgi:hypothetical protein
MKKLTIQFLSLLLLITATQAAEPLPYEKSGFGKAAAFDPILNRGRGYLSKGELQFATHNYGSFIEFEDYSSPSGLYKGYQYISDVSLILGVPGKLPDGSFAPWAMRPIYLTEEGFFDDDTLVYWGSTVSESWFDRVTDKKQVDWESAEGHYGQLHSGDVLAGEIYGGIYTDTGDPYPLLASSDIPDTWPLKLDDNGDEVRTWPGDWAWDPITQSEVFGRHIGDQDIYMEFNDRLATRDEDPTQGYPMGVHIKVNAHSYGRSYAEDIAFFTVEVTNDSWKGFPLDFNGDGEPDQIWLPITHPDGSVTYEFQPKELVSTDGDLGDGSHYGFNYKEMYGGFYFDVDSYSRTASGSYVGRSNDDDMMAYDQEYDMAFIWDLDDDSNGAEDLAYSALKLLDTPAASRDLDLDGNGTIDVAQGESLGLTDWHWFDWYARPGVESDENSGGSCSGGGYAGSAGCPGALDKENIMYALMAGDTSYAGTAGATYSDWEWRGIATGSANPLNAFYDQWYFHPAQGGAINPHFDSAAKLLEDYPDGLDCVFIMSAGPFDLDVSETTHFSFAVIMGDPPDDTESTDTPPDLVKNAEMAQIMYDLKYQGFSPPDAPTVSAIADDGVVTLYWDSKAEYSEDIVTGIQDFQGYKIYKSTDGGTTWGNPRTDIIYDSDQNAVGWKPIAQYDLTEEEEKAPPYNYSRNYKGPDPVAPWFNLGNDTGLEYRYIDQDVINGVEYCYAVVAYDIGIDTLYDADGDPISDSNQLWDPNPDDGIDEEVYKWDPLEYLENFKGNSPLLPQFVRVTPDARPGNAPQAASPVRAPWNQATGIVEVLPADVNALRSASGTYKIVVDADSTWVGDVFLDNPLQSKNSTYSVYNMDTGDTIIGWVLKADGSIDSVATRFADREPIPFTDGTIFGRTWDGFVLFTENFIEAKFDTIDWINHTPADSPTWDWEVTSQLAPGYYYAADYDFVWGMPDTAINNDRVMPFTIFNRTNGQKVKFDARWKNSEVGLPIYSEFPDFRNRMKFTLKEPVVPGYDPDLAENRWKSTWVFSVSWAPDSLGSNIHYRYPTIDTMRVLTSKPFKKGDEFYFDASSITQMNEVTKETLDQVRVVPNPYIVSADWERDINHKSLHFTHLPDECVIRIFTLTGELVYTILHNDIFTGQAEWNLRSMNRQEVAPGLYIFVVETPNHESYTGKFAVIR